MAASGPGITDLKILFARSGNRCAFPKCVAPIVLDETLIGEVCHIKGERPGSARHDDDQTDEERHTYGNLILMCRNHHTVIDDDVDAYTVERLTKMKSDHEARSAPLSDQEAAAVAVVMNAVTNVGQTGGLSANIVNASSITVHSAASSSHLTHQRQIVAVERLWQIARKMNSEFGLLLLANSVLTSKELDAYFRTGDHSHFADCLREYAELEIINRKLENAGASEAENERPFVSHGLWSVFFVLRGMYGRTAFLIGKSYVDRKFLDWRTDSGCIDLLRSILPERVVKYAKEQGVNSLHRAFEAIESQFLAEAGMNKSQA